MKRQSILSFCLFLGFSQPALAKTTFFFGPSVSQTFLDATEKASFSPFAPGGAVEFGLDDDFWGLKGLVQLAKGTLERTGPDKDFLLTSVDILTLIHFNPDKDPWDPYAMAGIGLTWFDSTASEISFFDYGLGIEYFLSDHTAIQFQVPARIYRVIDGKRFGIEGYGLSVSILLGINLHWEIL